MIDSIRQILQNIKEPSAPVLWVWDTLASASQQVLGLFSDYSHSLAWPYLLSSLAAAWLLYIWANRRESATARSFREFAFPDRLYCHPSTRLDFRFLAVDVFLYVLLYVPIISALNLLAGKVMGTVISGLTSWEPPRTLSAPQAFGAAIGFMMMHDFITYWTHVFFHKIPVLWAFHQVHHSAQVLTPATAYRVHPVELIAFALCNAPIVGLAIVFYQNFVGQPMQIAAVFGLSIFGLLGSHLRHSHILFSFGPVLSRIVLSPAQHVIHHGTDAQHWNRNFGVKLAFWDWLFGTLYVPSENETVRPGLRETGTQPFSSVFRLYVQPFVRAVQGFAVSSEVRR